jgi:pilus assembly protein Flp/PilA
MESEMLPICQVFRTVQLHRDPNGLGQQPLDRAQTVRVGPKGAILMKTLVSRFVKDESGATAIEYGLIAAGISVAIIAVVNGIGTKLNTSFTTISSQLK